MTVLAVILALFVGVLLGKLYGKWDSMDVSKMLSNRAELWNLTLKERKAGLLDKAQSRMLLFFFHPDFKNIFDHVPPDRQEYTRKMYKLDSDFWKSYKLTPDFAIPASMVYELYKEYLSQQVNSSLADVEKIERQDF